MTRSRRILFAHGLSAAAACLSAALPQAQSTTFSNQTTAAGLGGAMHRPTYADTSLAGGAVGDFNRDGFQDIFQAAGGGAPDRLFINNGNGTFTDRAQAWGIATAHRGTGAAVGDFDGDGWLDLYVTSLGPVSGDAAGSHLLYHNDAGTGFTDVAASMNVNSTGSADGWGASFGDYDMDGDLDLAVCGWRTGSANKLFRNDGTTFTDVTAIAGLTLPLRNMFGFAVKFVDMDGDRDPELIWIGDFGSTRYLINNGNGTFTDFTGPSNTAMDGTEMGVTVTDVNEDGRLDFYVTTIATNNLYINQGNHQYTNLGSPAGVANAAWGWGTVAIDMNHNSRVDLVSTTQSFRQFVFRNVSTSPRAPSFNEVALQIGLTSQASGRGLSNLDYDNDGDQDLLIFSYTGTMELHRNDLVRGADTHWLRVFLDQGCSTTVAPDGVGAIVRATIGTRTLTRVVEAGSNYLSNSELSAHFGIGAATTIDSLVVEWPDGQDSTLTNVPVDRPIVVRAPSNLACAKPTGAGCVGGSGVPSLAPLAGSTPSLGSNFNIELSGIDASGAPAALLFSIDRPFASLPLDLLGFDGCRIHTGGIALQSTPVVNSGGVASLVVPISTDPVLQGFSFMLQGIAADATAPHTLGISLSNGLQCTAN